MSPNAFQQPDTVRNCLYQAYRKAQVFSDDPTTQTGAVLVTRQGHSISSANQFATSSLVEFRDSKKLTEHPAKRRVIEHAERAVIYEAAKRRLPLVDATMYAPWAACCDCARAIILSGISRLVVHKEIMSQTPQRWAEDIEEATWMLQLAGVEYHVWSGAIGGTEIKFDGKSWKP